MFQLSKIEDIIKIKASLFNDEIYAINQAITLKYVNKVLKNVGLIISMYDIISIGDRHVYPGDDGAHINVVFRLIVFKPFIGEVITGKLISSNARGVKISLGFFDNIFIFPDLLQPRSSFDEQDKVWVWPYEDHRLEMNINEDIIFRVHTVKCVLEEQNEQEEGVQPMIIIGTINDQGLGMIDWWKEE